MKQKQVYQTKKRQLIQEFVITQKNMNFTANDVYRHFIMGDNQISLPTIYRQLDKMTEEGLLEKYRTAESDTAFYAQTRDDSATAGQSHMKCTSCGKTFPLQCHEAAELAEHIGHDHHFFVKLNETVFYGRCEACAHA